MDGVRSEDKASRCFHSYGGRRIIRSSAAALPRFPTACRPAGASGSSSWHPSPSFDDHAALRWPALISSSQAAHATRLSWCCHTQLRLKTQPHPRSLIGVENGFLTSTSSKLGTCQGRLRCKIQCTISV